MEAFDPGSQVGHLRIEEELGRGGFATVYRAEDMRLGRRVALKVLHSPMERGADPTDYSGFLAEARVIARLESPNVVTLFSLQETDDGALMLEMEFVPGGTLDEALQRGVLSPDRAEAVLRDVLLGLASAHEGGVLHRDVKPANILLARDGAAKLTDFGLARVMGEEVDPGGGAGGTPIYMAPEVLAGSSASEQSDIWSVGVVAYETLAGRRPFPTTDTSAFFVAVQNEAPSPLPPTVPPHLRSFVMACLEKEATGRPVSCRDALVLLERTSAPPIPAPPAAPPAPSFHGRREELDRVHRVIESDGQRVLVITGVAGVGKTALATEAARRARLAGTVWIDANLSAIESPLVTLVEAARLATAFGEDAATSAFGPEGEQFKAILRGDDMPAFESAQQTLWTMQHLLLGIARASPLVLSVDDAQHASEEDVQLLVSLARRMEGHKFTLLISTRPAAHATAGLSAAERLDLEGLDPEALFAFLEDRLGARFAGRVAKRVHRRTEGNPLHATELMRHLEETGALARCDAGLEPTARWEKETVPARLRDVVHARLASLDEDSRALLEVAAVDGPLFDGRAVAGVQELPVLHVLRSLQALTRSKSLISRAAHGYRFADRLTQEVLYDDMAPELRVELHRALAEHLESRDEEIHPARLGRHWERCGERERAAPYLLRVAGQAYRRQELRRLVDLAGRAGLLDDPPLVDPMAHVDIVLGTASALMRRGDHDQSGAIVEQLRTRAQAAGDRIVLDRILVHRATAHLVNGRLPEGDEAAWDDVAERLGQTLEGGRALAVVGRLAKLDGDLGKARSAFEKADDIFLDVGNEWQHSMMQDQLGSVAMRAGRLTEARAFYAVAAEVADRIGILSNAAISRTNAALAHMLDGHVDGVDEELRRSIRSFDLAGSSSPAAHVRIYLAEALYAQGDTDGALAALDLALPGLSRARHGSALTNAWRFRAELLLVRGRLDEAAAAIAQALEHAGSDGDRTQRIVAHAVAALVATVDGRVADAMLAVEAMEAANPDGEAPADGAVLVLSEAVLFGLPADALERAESLARSAPEQALRAATLRHACGEAPSASLAELDVDRIGLRRASYRLMTAWLAAASAARGDDVPDAARRASAAREAADALAHEPARRALQALA